MGKWREYAENLDDCDDYMRQNVAPWFNQQLQQSLPEGCDEAQAQVSQAKVHVTLQHGPTVMSHQEKLFYLYYQQYAIVIHRGNSEIVLKGTSDF